MKKNVCFALAATMMLACSISTAFAQTSQNEIREYIGILKKKFKENPKPTGTINDLQQLKNPGEKYAHFFDSKISGSGTAKNVWKCWFDTETTMFIAHKMSIIIGETIISTQDEINQGILKSEYNVQLFDEQLLFAGGKIKIGYLDSQDVLKFIQSVAKAKGASLSMSSTSLMGVGIKALCAPEPTITKATAVVCLAAGAGLKIVDIGLDKLAKNTDENGNYKLDRETVEKNFPGYEDVVVRLHNLEGTKIVSEWRCGEGYTKIDIKPGAKWKESESANDDLEYLAKLIYRTNPLNSDKILPENSRRFNSEWSIDPAEIAGMIMTPGVEFDSVTGMIYVKNRGITEVTCPSEMAITGNDKTKMTEIGTSAGKPSKIHLESTLYNKQDTVVSFNPSGNLLMVTDKDAKGKPLPEYVYRVELSGKFDSEVKKPGGLLKKVSLDQTDVDIKLTYQQERSIE